MGVVRADFAPAGLVPDEALLAALVVPPPTPAHPLEKLDVRSLPTAQADGAYSNGPSRACAQAAGFRLQAPSRGQNRPGLDKICQAVERRHNFFAQSGRIGRPLGSLRLTFPGLDSVGRSLHLPPSGFVR
ncbi:MAG: hypothetical protein P9F75_05575 [Candidatus Contendobacter sp.]|nr:hypothetical protein [Candidatus Contendobacter sp.]